MQIPPKGWNLIGRAEILLYIEDYQISTRETPIGELEFLSGRVIFNFNCMRSMYPVPDKIATKCWLWNFVLKVMMLTECHKTKCAWDHNNKLHQEIADVFHGSFRRSSAIEELSKKSLTFFIRDEHRRVVCAAYGTHLTERSFS